MKSHRYDTKFTAGGEEIEYWQGPGSSGPPYCGKYPSIHVMRQQRRPEGWTLARPICGADRHPRFSTYHLIDWHDREEPITCKRCLRILEGESRKETA